MKKVVCITGVAGGIGSATARVFTKAGWHVIGVDRKNVSNLLSGVDRYISTDISNPDAIRDIFNGISQREGRLDALINNAAVQVVKTLVDTQIEEWDSLMAVNVRSVFLSIKYAYPLLRQDKGSVVNVSSVHAIATSCSMAAYATSKGAILALTRSAALELAADQVRVNTVLPGAIDTQMLRAGLIRGDATAVTVEQRIKELSQKHALGRLGKPEEIAQMILFLADYQKSAFITGQSIIVDGGATAQLSTE
jgi:NAD(P)-dependent dehydrogenase (short-subunit alcohol dehydrogenase family)